MVLHRTAMRKVGEDMGEGMGNGDMPDGGHWEQTVLTFIMWLVMIN